MVLFHNTTETFPTDNLSSLFPIKNNNYLPPAAAPTSHLSTMLSKASAPRTLKITRSIPPPAQKLSVWLRTGTGSERLRRFGGLLRGELVALDHLVLLSVALGLVALGLVVLAFVAFGFGALVALGFVALGPVARGPVPVSFLPYGLLTLGCVSLPSCSYPRRPKKVKLSPAKVTAAVSRWQQTSNIKIIARSARASALSASSPVLSRLAGYCAASKQEEDTSPSRGPEELRKPT